MFFYTEPGHTEDYSGGLKPEAPRGSIPGSCMYGSAAYVMKIRLNGEEYVTRDARSVEDLLKELDIDPVRVAVEVNLEIVRKSDYSGVMLKDGDTVEVVSFVGGGCMRAPSRGRADF